MSKWTPSEVALLVRDFPNMRTDDLAKALGRKYSPVAQKAAKLGLRKSAEYLAGPDAHRFDGLKGMGTRLKPGNVPWNKGRPGTTGVQEACKATQFKPGRPASDAWNYRPIGSTRINAEGVLEKKVTDDQNIKPALRWVPVHRLVWEASNGPVPDGCIVVFRPGQHTTDEAAITADRIEILTRRENMLRNSVHTKYPPELARLIQLRGALSRQINKQTKVET